FPAPRKLPSGNWTTWPSGVTPWPGATAPTESGLPLLAFFLGSKQGRMPSFNPRRQRMDEALQVYLKALTTEVQVAEIPEGCRHTTTWCLGPLPSLYTKFRETN